MFNKRELKKAVDNLNKAKKPAKPKDIIVDPKGQWAHPGKVTRIPSNKITMQGVGYPVLGVPNKGQPKMMMPGQYFEFPEADYVDEYPQMQDGGQIYTYAKRPGSYYKKDSKGNWMIKNESTHGKYVAIDDPKGTRSKVLNAQAKPLQKAPKVEETLVTKVKTIPQDNTFYDSTLQPGESTAVRNIIQKKIPDVIGKDAMTYLKEQKQKKEKAINKNIRAKNEKVKEFYKEYHESPRYQEMLQKSAPNDWEDYYFGRELNLEGYPDPKTAPKVHIRHKQPKDKPGTGGFSRNETGDITVLPRGFNVKGLLPHEWSHSTDRPIAYDNPFSGKPFAFRMGRVIPIKDSQWITKHKPKTWLESPEYKRKGAELKRIYKKYPDLIANSEEFMNYVGEPTETRARLNDIRFQAKQKGIYDPFTEKVTPAILNKLLKTRFEDSFKTEGFDALQQLRDVYTDEEIQWMLNNISKNQQAEEEGAQSFGRYGGQFKEGGEQGCKPGYYWNGKECVKSFVPVAKETPNPLVKNKKEQELLNYGKKALPNKKSVDRSVKNIPFYGDLSEWAQPDDLQENITEFVDPSGYFSWDDAYRAKAAWDKSGSEYPSANQALDMFGAVPGLGKLGKLKYLKNASAIKNSMKYVAPAFGVIPWQSILNAFDTGQDVSQDNIKYQDGGDLDSEVDLTVLPEDGRSYYDPILDQMYLNPFADKEEINHELTHAWQNRTGALRSDPLSPKMRPPAAVTDEQAATYFNRKGDDVQYYLDNLQSIYPEMTGNIWTPDMSAFIPEEVQYNRAIDPLMYYDAGTMEGEAEMMSQRFGPPPLEITYQDGGEKDKWGRRKGSKWYGFDPKTKKYTTKDNWGRSPEDKWYGFNPNNQSWSLTNQGNKTNKGPAPKEYKLEEDIVDPLLGSPQKKGAKFANGVDNLRHSMSSYYTAKGLQPYLGTPASIVGANVLGAAHEVKRIFQDPDDWSTKLRTSGEDMFNNAVGSAMSILPESWAKGSLKYLSDNNLLPDGVDWQGRNAYVKKYGGVPQYAPGGSAGCPPGSYWNGKDCVKVPKGAKVITDPIEYEFRKAAYDDSLQAYNKGVADVNKYKKTPLKYYDTTTGKYVGSHYPVKRVVKSVIDPVGYYGRSDARTNARADYFAKTGRRLPVNLSYKNELIKDYYHRHYRGNLGFTLPWEDYENTVAAFPQFKKPKQPVVFAKESSKEEPVKSKLKTKPVTKKEEVKLIKKEEPVTKKEEPVKQEVVIDKLPIKPALIDQPKGTIVTQSRTTPEETVEETDVEYTPEYSEEGGPDSVGYHVEDRTRRYIDWNGRSIGYNLPRFRKPGHGGDLIKKGERRYLHLPTIERRTEAWLEPNEDIEEQYQDGGVSPIEGDLISKVLMNRNRGVDFVDRAYALGDNPGTPLFNVPDDEEFGNRMSHKMSWGTDDQGQTWMFPTVLNPNDEAIKVPNQYADYISSEGYKNATGMNYQDGGQYKTKLTPEEEFDFQSFFRTLPDNLQTDDDTYDIRGYWDSEGRPEAFNYDQPKEKDGYYHAYSINQNTGEYLKSPAHDTFQHAVDEDRKIGYRPITNIQGRNIAVENQSIADPEEQSYLRNMEGPANYIELDLTPEEIQEYAKGGYIIEDISVPSLTKAKKGGIFGRRKKRKEKEAQQQQPQYVAPVEVDDELYESVTPYAGAPEDFKKGVGNIKEVGVAAKAPDWLKFSREYENKNSRQAFIDKKKRDYLNNTNKGLAKAAGLNMENFPEQVERNFANEYDYKKNSYIMKKLSKSKGFSLKRRGEWVDELTKPERQILADSKYESKLQPSIWARTNAGLRTLYDQIKGKQYSPVGKREKYEGMTAKESKDIQDSGLLGALNVFAPLEAPGYVLANLANRTGNLSYGSGYRKDSDFDPFGEVELMSGVNPLQATIFNPLTYTAPYDLVSAGPSLFTAARNLLKRPGAVRAAEELATIRPALTAGAEEAAVVQTPRRITNIAEADPNAYRRVVSGTIEPETRMLPEAPNRNVVTPDDANIGDTPYTDDPFAPKYDELYDPMDDPRFAEHISPPAEFWEPDNTFSGITADDIDYDYITQAYKDKAMNELNASNITRRDIAAPTDQFNVPPPETFYQQMDPSVVQPATYNPGTHFQAPDGSIRPISELQNYMAGNMQAPSAATAANAASPARAASFRIVNGNVISEEVAFAKDVLQQQLGLPANADMPSMIQAVNRMDMTDPVRVDFEQAIIRGGYDPDDIYNQVTPRQDIIRHQLVPDAVDITMADPFPGLRPDGTPSNVTLSPQTASTLTRNQVGNTGMTAAELIAAQSNPLDAVNTVRSLVTDGSINETIGREVMNALRTEIRNLPISGADKKFLIKEAKRISQVPKTRVYSGSNLSESEITDFFTNKDITEIDNTLQQGYGYTVQDVDNAISRYGNNPEVSTAIYNQVYDDFKYMRDHNMPNPNNRVFDIKTNKPSSALLKADEIDALGLSRESTDLIKKTRYETSGRNTTGTVSYSDVDDPDVYYVKDKNLIPKTEDLDELIAAYEEAYNKATDTTLKKQLRTQLEDYKGTKWLRTEFVKELEEAGLKPSEIKNVSIISNTPGNFNLIKGDGEVLGSLNAYEGNLVTGEPAMQIGSTGLAYRNHGYGVGKAHTPFADFDQAKDYFSNEVYNKELSRLSPEAKKDPINLKTLKTKANREADELVAKLKENNNNRYGEALYRGVHHGVKDTRGPIFTQQSFAQTTLPDPITGAPVDAYRARLMWNAYQNKFNKLGIPKAELLPQPPGTPSYISPQIKINWKLGGDTSKLNKFIR